MDRSLIVTVLDLLVPLGALIVMLVVAGKESLSKAIPYFTVQSNLLSAFMCLVCAIWSMVAEEPMWLLVVRFASTCSVAVTFMTVICYLGPRFKNWGYLLGGYNFWLHLAFPLMAIASLLLRSPVAFPFTVAFTGLVPVILYGILYFCKVILAPPERKWDDLYGFADGVNWKTSVLAMGAGTLAISVGLWALSVTLG